MVYDPGPVVLVRARCDGHQHRFNPHHGKDGKFSSGGGGGSPDFESTPTGAGALAALPGSYVDVIHNSPGLGGREAVQLQDAIDGPNGYAREGYVDVNRALYSAHGGSLEHATPEVRAQIGHIDRLMQLSHTEHDIIVHRGTSEPGRILGKKWKPDGDNTGLEWTHHAYESTSARHQIADEFARGHNASALHRSDENHPTMLSIFVPKGHAAVQLTGMDRYEGEGDGTGYAEVLLPRGGRHRIVNDHGVVGGIHYLEVELLS